MYPLIFAGGRQQTDRRVDGQTSAVREKEAAS